MAWTEAHENELRRRWNAGESAAQIAAVLPALPPREPGTSWRKVTRDMVIGKARRMGLPSRPSPIKRGKADV